MVPVTDDHADKDCHVMSPAFTISRNHSHKYPNPSGILGWSFNTFGILPVCFHTFMRCVRSVASDPAMGRLSLISTSAKAKNWSTRCRKNAFCQLQTC